MSQEQVELTPIQMMQGRKTLYERSLDRRESQLAVGQETLTNFQEHRPDTPEEIEACGLARTLNPLLERRVGVLRKKIEVLHHGISALTRESRLRRLRERGSLSGEKYDRAMSWDARAQALIAPKAPIVKPESAKLPEAVVPQISFVVFTGKKGATINGERVNGNFGLYFAAGIAQSFKNGQTELPREQLQQLLPPAGDKSSGTFSTYLSRARKIFTELGFKITLRKTGNIIEAMILEGTLSQPVPDSINNLPVIRLGDRLYVNGILFQGLDAKVLQALAPTYLTKPPKYVPRANIQGILGQARGAQIPTESLRAKTSEFLSEGFEPRLNQASLALDGKRSGRSLLYRLIDQQTVTPAESASEGVQPEPAGDVKKKPSAPLNQEV